MKEGSIDTVGSVKSAKLDASSLCRIDLTISDGEQTKEFDIDFTLMGSEQNKHRFYIIDKNSDGSGATAITALNPEIINKLTIEENDRFQLLTIFDFAN